MAAEEGSDSGRLGILPRGHHGGGEGQQDVYYVLGLARNVRLEAELQDALARAQAAFE